MLLRELFEAPRKVAVAAFGRMNPPTIGHEKLVDKVKSFEGDHYIFLSQTQKPKDNPLPFDVKLEFAKKFFPGVNVGHPSVRTPIQMLQMLEKLGYTDIIYVAGSDRVASFEKLFNDYNGKEYNFNSITVENAGERDPDADGAEGMSASKMRAAAAAGDFEAFAQGVPTPALAQKMYDAVRTGMGVKDAVAAEDVSPEDEKKFHNELDDLVHKYFGDSPDEEKMKKKMRKVKEGSPISDLKKIITSKVYKQEYLMALKMMKQEAISAADAARRFMHVDARTLDKMAKKIGVTENVKEANYGRYYCSTDKKWKQRKGPKQSRKS
jgi:hypothetical protein